MLGEFVPNSSIRFGRNPSRLICIWLRELSVFENTVKMSVISETLVLFQDSGYASKEFMPSFKNSNSVLLPE